MKCEINENNEIINFWEDEHAPAVAVDCDKLPDDRIHATGDPHNQIFLYKLVEGKITPTEAGIAWKAQEYVRNRKAEYPTIAELTVALYDTDDKSAVEAKRAAVKAKYPKPE